MYDCHKDILAYHNEEVTLSKTEQDEMRKRRDTNRQRLKAGLERDGETAPSEFKSQGSYAHRTMVQQPDKDYDIDDGVYFWKDNLEGPNGGDKTSLDAKKMVQKALDDAQFNKSPEVRTNCVRVYYNKGYHLDVPVYRKVKTTNLSGEEEIYFELASSDWKEADPAEVTRWFQSENESQSPDTTNGRQLRRQTRLNKAFARSRESWRPRIATGFMITTLIVNECYRANVDREDKALYDTMMAMRNRLKRDLEIQHPIVEGENLTKDSDEGRTKFLLEKLDWAIDKLDVLFKTDCTQSQALKAWDKVFDTTFFSDRINDEETENQQQAEDTTALRATILIEDGEEAAKEEPVDKRGGGRYA